MIKPSTTIAPMLCMDLEVNGVFKEHGLDADKVTAAYRKAILEGLARLMKEGFVAERKAGQGDLYFTGPFSQEGYNSPFPAR